MKLKRKRKGTEYNRSLCSMARCKGEATHTYAASTPLGEQAGGCDVHLCDKHQEEWAQESGAAQESGGAQESGAAEGSEEAPVEKASSAVLAPLPSPETQQSLEKEAADAEAVLQDIEEFAIAEQTDLEFANEVLGDVKRAWKELDERKKKATQPMNQALKEIRSWFKPAQDFYSKAERILKKKIDVAFQRAREEQDRALQEAQEAHAAGDETAVQEALTKSQAVELEQPKDVSLVEGWDFEIVDPSKLPRQYLVPDIQAIRGVVKALGDKAEIPGVKVFPKTTVVRRNA